MSPALKSVLTIVGVLFVAFNIAAGLSFVERRLLGLWQDRYGPNRVGPFGVLQLAADIIKLLFKEDWLPPFADKAVFIIAPGIIVTTVLLVFAVVPFAPSLFVVDLNIGVLFFLGMSALGVYSIVLGSWASNSKYPLLGGIRGAAQMMSYEVFMGLSMMGVVMLAGSFSLRDIVLAQRKVWFVVPQLAGFVVFFVAGIAEARRLPFDLPEAESELVAGYHSEYSGMKFGLYYLGEYLGITLVSALAVTLFFGGWLGPRFLPPVAWFFIKTFIFIGIFILMRAALPRPRYDQLMRFGWQVLLPVSVLNLMVTGAVALASR